MASLTIAHGLPTVLRTPVRRAQRPAARSQHVVRVSASESWINKDIEKDSAKVATMCSSKEIDGKAVFCRCWKSATFPYCNGAHVAGIGFKVGRASKWTRNLVARCGSIHGNNERTNIIPSCLVVRYVSTVAVWERRALHNKATGDNVGPLIISMDAAAPSNQVSGPL
eukprot:CAMPEP_0114270788 /NCGR_PEP_ID=MMETSP0058-20121206/27447_1 /TAXON_ID=36894 /ORGANISM="Pyramimonas parkeae, CCMP726" /LENGTH=167 /DNA_ID=CAMNT_0001389593 /DNA_START=89 /DNA_END=589 /DNA_ORIENTATION=-